jgi:CRISPR-associated protein Cas1
MYAMRFPGEDTAGLTMQQLRGREGVRVRRAYLEHSKRTGVPWNGRDYDPEEFEASDAVNQALSAANTALYGVVHSVVVALGCAPGLGFVHTGHMRSFVFDIADLYKVDLTVPLAFDLAASGTPDVPSSARRALRDRMRGGAFMQQCVSDIRHLLAPDDDRELDATFDDLATEVTELWGGTIENVPSGKNYG